MSSSSSSNNDRISSAIETNLIFGELSFVDNDDNKIGNLLVEKDIKTTIIIGKKETLLQTLLSSSSDNNNNNKISLSSLLGIDDKESNINSNSHIIKTMINSIDDGECTSSFIPLFVDTPLLHQFKICILPNKTTRNNHPMSPHIITKLLQDNCPKKDNVRIITILNDNDDDDSTGTTTVIAPGPIALAIGKAFPLFNKKTKSSSSSSNDDGNGTSNSNSNSNSRNVYVTFVQNNNKLIENDKVMINACKVVSDGVRLAQRLSDTHPDQLTTDAFSLEVHDMVNNELLKNGQGEGEKGAGLLDGCKISIKEIIGNELQKLGYGGLYNVGKCATCPPRLLIISYEPPPPSQSADDVDFKQKHIALVGKGIVYDTGGLGIKTPKTNMCGMKHDMGGAAGLYGGFVSAVKLGCRHRVTLVLCIAENAIGPNAVRNDDIITLYSGKTVEINNSDAEGRLVLGDGVAHVTKHYINDLDLVVDMATLTGAQSVTTGQRHGSVLTPSKAIEDMIVKCGAYSGDLCYPILYLPEILMNEFKSSTADMKNSVANRSNAQCSCAGHFIESHINENYDNNNWIHIDMAGPSLDPRDGSRSTGYGVGLILSLLDVPGF